MTRSRCETMCLRVVLGIYAAVAIIAVVFWRESFEMLRELTAYWSGVVEAAIRNRTLPSVSRNLFVPGCFLGGIVASALLAEQFVSHALARGWRLPGRWIWRACILHAVIVLSWVTTILLSYPQDKEGLFYAIIPILLIATTKLTCAILVLREKRLPTDGE